jgi:RNA polymerase sigma-70 factor (ECF subfamily)
VEGLNDAVQGLRALGARVDTRALEAWLNAPRRKAGPHRADLALAFACFKGDAAALAFFERTWVVKAQRTLEKARFDAAVVDDVLGWLRFELFARDGERLIETYSGKSDLGAWLRAIVLHQAVHQVKRRRREVTHHGDEHAVPVPSGDLVALQGAYGPQFTQAIEKSFRALSVEQRNLLRQYFLDGLSIDVLAKMHQVHRATAARRVKAASDALNESVRAELKLALQAGDGTVDKLFTAANLQQSLSKILRKTGE